MVRRLERIAPQHAQLIASATTATFIAGGEQAADFINEGVPRVVVRFDVTNDFAVRQMRQNDLRLVREFTNEQAQAASQALNRSVNEGRNPREAARIFRGSIGLTSRQELAVANYRRALETGDRDALRRALRDRRFDRTVLRSIETGRPLSAEQVDRFTERYRQRWIRFRSETIARTEALRAANGGSFRMYQQAVQEGVIDPLAIRRRWIPTRDNRLRDSHAAVPRLNPDGVGYDQPFVTGNGNFLLHPGDPNAPASDTVNCRCAVTVRLEDPDNG